MKQTLKGLFFKNLFLPIPRNLPPAPLFLVPFVKLKREVERCRRRAKGWLCLPGALPVPPVPVWCRRLFPAGCLQTCRLGTTCCHRHGANQPTLCLRPSKALLWLVASRMYARQERDRAQNPVLRVCLKRSIVLLWFRYVFLSYCCFCVLFPDFSHVCGCAPSSVRAFLLPGPSVVGRQVAAFTPRGEAGFSVSLHGSRPPPGSAGGSD